MPEDSEYVSEAEARSADYRRREELSELYTAVTLSRASALERQSDGLRMDPDDPDGRTFHVTGSTGNEYIVQLIDTLAEEDDVFPWVMCSCPNGQNKGGQPRCFHSAAVLLRYLRAKI